MNERIKNAATATVRLARTTIRTIGEQVDNSLPMTRGEFRRYAEERHQFYGTLILQLAELRNADKRRTEAIDTIRTRCEELADRCDSWQAINDDTASADDVELVNDRCNDIEYTIESLESRCDEHEDLSGIEGMIEDALSERSIPDHDDIADAVRDGIEEALDHESTETRNIVRDELRAALRAALYASVESDA